MTTINDSTGRILWSPESKYYLLRLIKENIVIISPDVSAETMTQKDNAWRIIEQSFAADGMPCQLGKLKRLWKRMKDSARQNMLRFQEQKRRGHKNPKKPTDLEMEVAEMIAMRNNNRAQNKQKLKNQAIVKQGLAALRPNLPVKVPPIRKFEVDVESENNQSYLQYHNSLIQNNVQAKLRLRQQQNVQQEQQIKVYNEDLFEPVTILEEFNVKREQPTSYDDVDENPVDFSNTNGLSYENGDTDEDANNIADTVTMDPIANASQADSSTTGTTKMQKEILLQDLRYKQLLRDHELEKMTFERELYKKKLELLELQITKTNLEVNNLKSNLSPCIPHLPIETEHDSIIDDNNETEEVAETN